MWSGTGGALPRRPLFFSAADGQFDGLLRPFDLWSRLEPKIAFSVELAANRKLGALR